MAYQNLQIAISPADKTFILQKIQDLKTIMTFVINLTLKERKKIGMASHDLYSFLKAAYDHAEKNQHLLPPTFSLAQWKADIDAFDDLRSILQQVNQLQESLSDTLLALKVESQNMALNFYKLAQIAAKTDVPGTDEIVQDLATKLSNKRKK